LAWGAVQNEVWYGMSVAQRAAHLTAEARRAGLAEAAA
jgi:hypothetical protein